MADVLTTSSRNFYERTRGKVVVSLVLGSASLMLLGFCSYSGGTAANFQSDLTHQNKLATTDDFRKTQLNQLVSGYGFASFCYIISFLILAIAAIYVSPILCGSVNEAKMLKGPHEIDTGYTGSEMENDKQNV